MLAAFTTRLAALLALACSLLHAGAALAAAEKRLALVIGNQAYQGLPALKNPIKDAQLIKRKLDEVGFETEVVEDAKTADLGRAFRVFARKVEQAGEGAVALIYYAGHGVQDDKQVNYLIGVDADLKTQSDLALDAVPLDTVMRAIENARPRLAIVVLDACRDNPLPATTRGARRGLADEAKRTGFLIAFSTAPGKVALDGDGDNSPYALALAEEIGKPGIEVEQMFKSVRIRVLETTKEQQPWETTSLSTRFYFGAPPAPATPAPSALLPVDAMASGPPATPPAGRPRPGQPPVVVAEPVLDPTIEYNRAVESDTVEAYQGVLNRFPAHPRREVLVRLIERKSEERVWLEAERAIDESEKLKKLDLLMLAFPQGAYVDRARQRVAELKARAAVTPPPRLEPPSIVINPLPGGGGAGTGGNPGGGGGTGAGSFHYVDGLDPGGFNWLALRNAPSVQAPWSPTKLTPGTLLTVLGQEGDWYRVRLPSGETGYAAARYIFCCRGGGGAGTGPTIVTRPPPTTTPPPVARPVTQYWFVSGLDPGGHNWLALRSAPSASAPWSPTRMGPGTLVEVLGQQGEWKRVRLRSGETGWASARYLACCRAQ